MDLLNKQKPLNQREFKPPAHEKVLKKIELDTQSVSDFNLKSISQCLVPNNSVADDTGKTTNRTSTHAAKFKPKMSIVAPPILGSLGPDMEAIQDKVILEIYSQFSYKDIIYFKVISTEEKEILRSKS